MGPRKRNPEHPEAQSEFHEGRRIVYGSVWLSISRHQTFGAGKAVVLGRPYFHRPRPHDQVYQARQQDPHYRLRGMEKVSEALP